MIDKLVSVREFKDWLNENIASNIVKYTLFSNYIDLLEQPLKLGMFVPCDESGEVLDNPKVLLDENLKYETAFNNIKQFQQAEERVLFDGFEYENHELKHNGGTFWIGRFNYGDKISDLLNHWAEIKLTNNFKKLITG